MNIVFEKACSGDATIIIEIYTRCKRALLDCDIYQWGDWGKGYPHDDYVKAALINNELFIIKVDGNVAGAVVLNEIQSEEWQKVKWNYTCGKALIIHALVIDPEKQGKGLGKILLSYCERYAEENKYNCIRLDSFVKNGIANNLYLYNGYQIAGTVIFDSKPEGNKEYYCYEKKTGANL